MAKKTDTTTTESAPDPILKIRILTHAILIGGAHHAKGKVMSLPKSKADTLAAMNPPAVEVIGIP